MDILVNNAGFGRCGKFESATAVADDTILMVNINALVALTHLFIPGMLERKKGGVLNVASTASFQPLPFMSIYAATKAFVLSLTESLWYEQKSKGVYVMALCPGVTTSGFHEAAGGAPNELPSASLTQTPEEVVAEALHALHARRKPMLISGWKNRLGLFFTRFLTHKKIVKLMGSW